MALDTNGAIYNFDETNVRDNLDWFQKGQRPQNCKKVEQVQNFSRIPITIMVCGSAIGEYVYNLEKLVSRWSSWNYI